MSGTRLFTRPIYWLLVLALVVSLAVVAVPMGSRVNADPSEVWVDDDNCPGPGSGTEADPYCKIKDALTAVAQPGTVHVATGTYTENNIDLKNNVQVLGAGAAVTIIDGGGSGPVVTASSGVGASTKLDGFTITNGTTSNGAGMSITDGASPVISNCKFVGNSAAHYGGGMRNLNSSPTVTNCTFDGNSATDAGGGMYNEKSSPNVTNCIFDGNSATYGGGMYNWDSSPTVTNCTFEGNNAPFLGGGMYNVVSSPNVTNCIFEGNSALNGCGMYNSNSSPNVTNCVFSGNSLSTLGGGMYNYYYSSPTVTNCIFEGNSAQYYGGGMYNDDYSSPNVTNCILANNTAGGSGGGICADGTSSPTIDYNDVWNNSPNDYEGCSPGPHDIQKDPMFVNPAAHDYHSQPGSPCIDAGTNDGAPGGDMDGNPRTIDGDGDGNAITDMGAYEYVPASVEFSATPTMGPTPLEVHFTDESPGDFDSWSWDFGDGGTSSEQNPAHVYTLPGPFTVSLSISSLSGRGAETKVNYIHPYTQGVGGEAYPVNRLAILAPLIALGMAFIAGSFMILRRRRAQG